MYNREAKIQKGYLNSKFENKLTAPWQKRKMAKRLPTLQGCKMIET